MKKRIGFLLVFFFCFMLNAESIIEACKQNNITFVNEYIQNEEDLTITDENGNSLFFIACEYGNIEIAKALLQVEKKEKWYKKGEKNFNVNSRDETGKTVFMRACENENIEVIKFLTDTSFKKTYGQRCNVLMRDNDGHDAFMLLVISNKTSLTVDEQIVADRLLMTNEDIKNASDKFGKTPLILAIESGHVEAVDYLMRREVSIDASEVDGINVFLTACKLGMFSYAGQLLELPNSNINVQDSNGRTAILVAAEDGNQEAIDFLLDNGIDTSLVDNEGNTLFMKLCESHLFQKADEMLLNGQSINAVNNLGQSALYNACKNCDEEVIKYLLTKDDIDVSLKDSNGRTAIQEYFNIKNLEWADKDSDLIETIIASDDLTLLNLFYHEKRLVAYAENNEKSLLVISSDKGSFNITSYFIDNEMYLDSLKQAVSIAREKQNENILSIIQPVYKRILTKKLLKVLAVIVVIVLLILIGLVVCLKKTAVKRGILKNNKKAEEQKLLTHVTASVKSIKSSLALIESTVNANEAINSLDVKNSLDKHISCIVSNKKIVTKEDVLNLIDSFSLISKNSALDPQLVEILKMEQKKLEEMYEKNDSKDLKLGINQKKLIGDDNE